MAATFDGPIKEVEFADWSSGFTEAGASWTAMGVDTLVDDNMQVGDPEENMYDLPDGTQQSSAARVTTVLPVRDLEASYLSTLTHGDPYVLRVTYASEGGTAYMLFGADTGARLSKGASGGATYGGVAVKLLTFTCAVGKSEEAVTVGTG